MEVPGLNAGWLYAVFFFNFNSTHGTNGSILYHYSVIISLISIKPQKVWGLMLRLSLANFHLLMISGLPCRCKTYWCHFSRKIVYNSEPKLVPKCTLYPFYNMPNLKAIWLCISVLWQFIASMWKEEKEEKNPSDFWKPYISEMAGAIWFRSVICSLRICRHLHSKFGFVWFGQETASNMPAW